MESNTTATNASQNDVDLQYKEPMSLLVTKLTVQITIALLGVAGNLLVCIVITKRASMKTTMNLYLRNLAIADLGVLLVNFPLLLVNELGKRYPFGRFVCLYIGPATEIFYGACIWSITIIAIERYRNIISSRAFAKRVQSFKKVTVKILLIWLVSFAVVAVPMYPIMVYDQTFGHCYPDWPAFADNLMLKTYVVVMFICWYLLPLAIIITTYSKISMQVKQSTMFHKRMHGQDQAKSNLIKEEEKQRLKQNKKAKRILTPLVLVFAITMLPFNIFRGTVAFSQDFHLDPYYYLYSSLCAVFLVINSAVDPLVYYMSSKEFRKVLLPMFKCSQHGRSHSSQSKSTGLMVTAKRGTFSRPTHEVGESEI